MESPESEAVIIPFERSTASTSSSIEGPDGDCQRRADVAVIFSTVMEGIVAEVLRVWKGLVVQNLAAGMQKLQSLFLQGLLGCGEFRDWNSERATGNIVEALLDTKFDRGGIAAVLSADANFKIGFCLSASADSQFHQASDAFLIELLKWIGWHERALDIFRHEFPTVVSAYAKPHLGEIVGAEGKEIRPLGNLIRDDAGSWDFDHGSHGVFQFLTRILDGFIGVLSNELGE